MGRSEKTKKGGEKDRKDKKVKVKKDKEKKRKISSSSSASGSDSSDDGDKQMCITVAAAFGLILAYTEYFQKKLQAKRKQVKTL